MFVFHASLQQSYIHFCLIKLYDPVKRFSIMPDYFSGVQLSSKDKVPPPVNQYQNELNASPRNNSTRTY